MQKHKIRSVTSEGMGDYFTEITDYARGATRMARGCIRLVHGYTKSTLITYFSGMKIDPKSAFLQAFFLILNLSVMSFPKFVYMTKNTSFFSPILHVFAPLKDVRAYSAWFWKTTLITWIFGRAWYPTWYSSAPPPPGWLWQKLVFNYNIATFPEKFEHTEKKSMYCPIQLICNYTRYVFSAIYMYYQDYDIN